MLRRLLLAAAVVASILSLACIGAFVFLSWRLIVLLQHAMHLLEQH